MARILGLDLGSYSIKAALFEGGSRAYRTTAFVEVPRSQEGPPLETLRAALAQLVAENRFQADQVVAALPGPSLATHNLTLPFGDTKRIEAALPFEVESQLPFELSEAFFDYQPVVQTPTKAELLVAVVRKEDLRAIQQLLQEMKLDPRILTHPAVTYQNLLISAPTLFQNAPQGEAVCILDIGHERTHITIGRPNTGLEFARTISAGGKDLSRAIAQEFKTSIQDANSWKETDASLLPDVHTPEGARGAGAIVRGLAPLLRDLRPSLKSFSARSHANVSRIYICGGTARLPGLAEQLSRDLGIPTEALGLPLEAEGAISAADAPKASLAFTLALRGQTSGGRGPRLNFRRGEFTFKGDFDYLREKVGVLAAFAAAILLLILGSGIARNGVLARREAQVDQLLCDTTTRILGRCEKDYALALNLLQGKESPAAAIPKQSAVNLLAEVAQRMPPGVTVSFDQVVVNLDRITLRGQTESSKQVDQITTSLKAFPCFKEVKEGKVERSKDGLKVNFNLDIQISCPAATPPAAG